MNQDAFIEEKRQNWEKLDVLLKRINSSGIKSFNADDVRLLGGLYRKVCSDLSYSRSRSYNHDLIRYLNQLARKAYGLIYLSNTGKKGRLLKFFISDYPAIIRKNFGFILFAALIFLAGLIAGYIWNHIDSNFSRAVVPRGIHEHWNRSAEAGDNENFEEEDPGAAIFPIMSSMYWTHNFKVGMYSFALGIVFGLGPLFYMIYNGLIFGALSSNMVQIGYWTHFFSFVLSHVFVELMAVFICTGAGFMLAWALISPGDLYRGEALNTMGKEAVRLVLGTIPLFLIAGIIESSISRFNIHIIYKIIFALITILLMILYFMYDPEKKKRRKYNIIG